MGVTYTPPDDSGVTDHGALTGLADDDHGAVYEPVGTVASCCSSRK